MRYQRTQNEVLQTEVDAGLALLDAKTNTYFLLNRTGSLIWDQLEEERSVDELCATVARKFEVTAANCKNDVEGMLSALTNKGLVVVSSDENP